MYVHVCMYVLYCILIQSYIKFMRVSLFVMAGILINVRFIIPIYFGPPNPQLVPTPLQELDTWWMNNPFSLLCHTQWTNKPFNGPHFLKDILHTLHILYISSVPGVEREK